MWSGRNRAQGRAASTRDGDGEKGDTGVGVGGQPGAHQIPVPLSQVGCLKNQGQKSRTPPPEVLPG